MIILMADALMTVLFIVAVVCLTSVRLNSIGESIDELDERLSNVEYKQTAQKYEMSYVLEQMETHTHSPAAPNSENGAKNDNDTSHSS